MLHFNIDTEKCVSCGLCAEDCLPQAIQMVDGHPVIPDENRCMRCLHCLTVCPTGAVSMLGHSPEESSSLTGALPSPEQMAALMKGRRSVRSYQRENVDPALLQRVLDVAAHAPTGVNTRKLWVTVIDDVAVMNTFREEIYEGLARLAREKRLPEGRRGEFFMAAPQYWREKGQDMIFRHAPHCVLVSNAKDAPCREQDPLIYLSYFELMGQSSGLGTLWCGLLYWCLHFLPELLPRLGIPETHELGYALAFGYPAVQYQRTAERGPAEVHRVL